MTIPTPNPDALTLDEHFQDYLNLCRYSLTARGDDPAKLDDPKVLSGLRDTFSLGFFAGAKLVASAGHDQAKLAAVALNLLEELQKMGNGGRTSQDSLQ
jgi:hypothetical protein